MKGKHKKSFVCLCEYFVKVFESPMGKMKKNQKINPEDVLYFKRYYKSTIRTTAY